jgi:hypothetical protein
MNELLIQVPAWIQTASLVLTALTLLATVLVRLTPSKVDDVAMGKVSRWVLKVLQILPTLGVNPQTKKMEEAIYELREKTNPGA